MSVRKMRRALRFSSRTRLTVINRLCRVDKSDKLNEYSIACATGHVRVHGINTVRCMANHV
jgi:hypothetical protein